MFHSFDTRFLLQAEPGPTIISQAILFLCLLFIFFPVEENESKEDARVPLPPARRQTG